MRVALGLEETHSERTQALSLGPSTGMVESDPRRVDHSNEGAEVFKGCQMLQKHTGKKIGKDTGRRRVLFGFETGSCYVVPPGFELVYEAQAGLELTGLLLPQSPKW